MLYGKWIGQIIIFNVLLMSVSVLSEYVKHSAAAVLIKIFQGCCPIKGLDCHLIALSQSSRIFVFPSLHYFIGEG